MFSRPIRNLNIEKTNIFKTAKKNFANSNKNSDFFHKNFSINNAPNDISSYNDIDISMTTEIFKSINMDNVSTAPIIVGRFSRLFAISEDFNHNVIMFLNNGLGLGMGLSLIGISFILRLLFSKINLRNQKNMVIGKMIYPEKHESNERIKGLQGIQKQIESKKIAMIDESFGIKNSPITFFISIFQIFLTMTNACLIQRFVYHVEDYPEVLTGGFLWFKDLSISDPFFILPLINLSLQIYLVYNNKFAHGSQVMISLRRFLYVVPIFSLPFMLTLESGLILYFCCATGNLILFNKIFESRYIRNIQKIPSSIDHSMLQNMNPKTKGEINNIRKLENTQIHQEIKTDEKKEKLYELKMKILNKDIRSKKNYN